MVTILKFTDGLILSWVMTIKLVLFRKKKPDKRSLVDYLTSLRLWRHGVGMENYRDE